MKIKLKQWSISWILIGLNVNQSEFSLLNFIFKNNVHENVRS